MGTVRCTIWTTIFCYLIGVSLAHSVTSAKAVRFLSPTNSSEALEKLFRSVRQGAQSANSSSKTLPLCSPGEFDQATSIDDTCLTCATNVDTGQVSDGPDGCCRDLSITQDLETAHFITCFNGCCIRSIGVLSPSSDREQNILNYEAAFIIKNDVTLSQITSLGQCVIRSAPSPNCGATCAVFIPEFTACSAATSFRVPGVGENFVDPPCDEVDDLSDILTGTGPSDSTDLGDNPDESAAPGDDGDDTLGQTGDDSGTVPEATAERTEEPEEGEGDGTDDPICFPATATVKLENGESKRMNELKTGDMVLVGAGKYSKVFGFTHQTPNYKGRFVEVRTRHGQVLRLTHGHYMYSDRVMRRAEDVRVGESVELFDGVVSKIVEVGEWVGVGLFNPQTLEGDIVVDGVLVSTYTDAVDARTAHSLLTPVRAISKWVDVSNMLRSMSDGLRRGRRLVTTLQSFVVVRT